MTSYGSPTDGIGRSSASHLNLTRSLADVARDELVKTIRTKKARGRPVGPSEPKRIPFAGKETA